MQQDRWTLSQLLAPTELTSFFEDYWEQAPLLASRPENFFRDLFQIEDLDHLFSMPGLVASENFRLLDRDSPGDVLPFDGGGDTLSQAQVYHAFDRGSTINVLGLHRFWPRVGAFCRGLEETLHHRIYCNLFFTPSNAKRLHAHYDDQDVLIIQLSGSKRWQIDEHCYPLPLRGDNADVPLGPNSRDFLIRQGDVLYLPRGFIHQPAVLDSMSLHLTVGITPHRWVDLVSSALITKSQREQKLRRALPPGVLFNPARHHELNDQFQQLISECLDGASLNDAVSHLAAGSLGEMYPLAGEHFDQLVGRDEITENTRVRRRPGMLCRVHVADGRSVIQFPGNQVFGPASISPALEYIAAAPGEFAVGDLPGLEHPSRIILVQQLVLEGLLTEII